MVRRNSSDSLYAPSLELEPHDEARIEEEFSNAPVEVVEAKISNPANDLEGLYLQLKSSDRDDLYDDETESAAKRAAQACGYKASRMDGGGFPTNKGGYYTRSIWFKHRSTH